MWVVLTLAFAMGAGLGLARLRVWALIPAAITSFLITAIIGSGLGLTLGRIPLVLFAVFTLLQVAYLIGAVLADVPERQRVSDGVPAQQELLRTVQMAIADELRVYFAPSLDDVPQQLRAKLAMLESR